MNENGLKLRARMHAGRDTTVEDLDTGEKLAMLTGVTFEHFVDNFPKAILHLSCYRAFEIDLENLTSENFEITLLKNGKQVKGRMKIEEVA